MREKSHCDISKKNIILGQDSSNVHPLSPFAKYVTNQMKKLLLLLIHPTKSSFNIICFCFCVGHVCFDLATTQLSDFRSSKSNATYIKRHLGTKSYFLSAGVTMLLLPPTASVNVKTSWFFFASCMHM